jgi:hypothetical protein
MVLASSFNSEMMFAAFCSISMANSKVSCWSRFASSFFARPCGKYEYSHVEGSERHGTRIQ